MSKKIAAEILTFVSDEQKNFSTLFQIRKYAFFNIWKSDEQKFVPGIFRFGSMLF